MKKALALTVIAVLSACAYEVPLCSKYYATYYQEVLQEAINKGVEEWGYAGYESPNAYAAARANVYVGRLKAQGACK